MNGGSLGSSKRKLDIKSESDALTLLQLVRGSTLDTTSKDEIRDLVFSLRTTFDTETLATLAVHVAPLAVELEGVAETVDSADTPDATAVAPSAPDQPTPSTVAPTPQPAQAASGFPARRPTPQFGAQPKPPAPPTTDSPVAFEDTAVSAEAESTASQESSKDNHTQETIPATPEVGAADTNPSAPEAPVNATSIKARIDEIKHDINTKVGNPVNLIDATNEAGREYMNALLEAMKAAGGGSNAAAALQRLEAAYQAVTVALEQTTPTKTDATPTPSELDTPVPEPAPEAETALQADTSTTTPDVPIEPVPPTEMQTPETPDPVADAPAEVQTDSATPTAPLTSVAAAQVETVAEQMPQPEPTPEPADALMSEAVTNGLEQLLNEWKLFKSGGILGTGPKGSKHPLYQELRNTPMNLVIAGRFEGATPAVKQSIHDYMNGWRYEQGMTHDLKETFEHYLRRVVKTIIDKQRESQ